MFARWDLVHYDDFVVATSITSVSAINPCFRFVFFTYAKYLGRRERGRWRRKGHQPKDHLVRRRARRERERGYTALSLHSFWRHQGRQYTSRPRNWCGLATKLDLSLLLSAVDLGEQKPVSGLQANTEVLASLSTRQKTMPQMQ